MTDTKKTLGLSPNIYDLASDLLDKVVDNELEILNSGDAKFSDEQVRQAQIMTRRDIVLLTSYMRNNVHSNKEIAKSIKLQNKLTIFLITGLLMTLATFVSIN